MEGQKSMCRPINATLVNGYMNHESDAVEVSKNQIWIKCYLWQKYISSIGKVCINLFFYINWRNI